MVGCPNTRFKVSISRDMPAVRVRFSAPYRAGRLPRLTSTWAFGACREATQHRTHSQTAEQVLPCKIYSMQAIMLDPKRTGDDLALASMALRQCDRCSTCFPTLSHGFVSTYAPNVDTPAIPCNSRKHIEMPRHLNGRLCCGS